MSISKIFSYKILGKNLRPVKFAQLRSIQTKSIRNLLGLEETKLDQSKIRVVGWVKSFRDQKEIKFIHLNDGSDSRNLQLVILAENFRQKENQEKLFNSIHFNTSIEVEGVLVKSTHKKQNLELHVTDLNIIGTCDPTEYPFKPKVKHTLEQIRPYVHLRPHVDMFASILRFRSELTMSIHEFFHRNKFTQVHTPLLTSNNCEGGCETFQVNSNENDHGLESQSAEFKKNLSNFENKDLENSQENLKYFFSKPVYLTASAQLHLEAMTTTLGNVYTLSPTFRAEKSLTRHHLAEFYMLEAELVDMNGLNQILDHVERFLKEVCLNTYEKFSKNDLDIILSNQAKNNMNYAEFITGSLKDKNFIRIKYKEAIEILNRLLAKKKYSHLAKKKIEFGEDLNKEQEKLLVEYFEQVPVFVTNYPKAIKPFYMRQSLEDELEVENFDLLAPRVGEIIGGSLREHRLDLLTDSIRKQNLDLNVFKYYLETKKYGAMKMGGYGLGLERLIQFLVNIENIRDTCAFPRSLYNCKM